MDCIKTEHEEETNSFSLSSIKVEKVDDEIQDSVQAVAVKKEIKAENDEEIETSFPIDGGEIKDSENEPKTVEDENSTPLTHIDISNLKKKLNACLNNTSKPTDVQASYNIETYTLFQDLEKPKLLECIRCNIVFSDETDLNAHFGEHSGNTQNTKLKQINIDGKPFSCSVCLRRFVKRNNMLFHMETHYECDICQAKVEYKPLLHTHICQPPKYCDVRDKPLESASCVDPECQNEERNGKSLLEQLLTNQTHIKETFKCGVCSKRFTRSSDLYQHTLEHKSEKPHSCKQCPRVFDTKSKLQHHMETHTSADTADNNEKCRPNQRAVHMQNRTVKTPYRCKMCGLEFHLISKFYHHMQRHFQKNKLRDFHWFMIQT